MPAIVPPESEELSEVVIDALDGASIDSIPLLIEVVVADV